MKLFNKVAAIAVGVVLATGVGTGVVLGSKNRDMSQANAANDISITFPGSPSAYVNAYNKSFTITSNSITFTFANWNNGQSSNSWTSIRGGSKNGDWTGTITSGLIASKVQSVVVSVSSTTKKGGGASSLEVATNSSFTTGLQTINKTADSTTGSKTYTVTTPTQNCYYRLTHNAAQGSANGEFRIDSITFNYAATTTYTVSFDANGGGGSMSNVTGVSGSYTLPANGFTAPANKAFAGWKAENAGDLIAVGGSYNVSANVKFYAQWVDAYTVTYTAGTNGSGTYAHTLQPAGTYELLPFANLTGVSASNGYKFKNYTVGGVTKNPGDTITLSAATAVTVNFETKPLEATYDFTSKFSTYASSWDNSYADHTGLNGKTDIGGEYAATIDLHKASKQTGTITNMPVFATKTSSGNWYQAVHFTLTESGYKIKEVQVTFAQWTTKTPAIALFKGNTVSGTPLDSGTVGTKNTISTSNLNGTDFSVGYCDKSTSNVQAGISSIYITVEALASFGTLDHITITGMPNNVYHIGETFDATGLAVTAYDGADEATANFKDVTASVETDLDNPTPFVDDDVPGFDCDVQYTGDGGSDTTSFHVYVYALAEYELVAEEQTNWSGTYLIVATNHNDDLVAMNGGLTDPDVAEGYKVVTDSSGIIEAGQELEWTIAKVTDGYSIQGKSGKYIGSLTAASNGMLVSGSALVNTIEYSDGDSATIIKGTNEYHLRISAGTGTSRFRYYSNGNVQLYKLVESSNADAYAQTFLGAFTCNADGTSQPTFTLKEAPSTYWSWSLLATEYNTLTAAEKEEFRLGVASETGTNVEKALARYDYIVGKYNKGQGITSYTDFMNRNPAKIGASRSLNMFNEEAGTAATMVVVVVSAISITAIGGFFLLKKKPF